MILLPTLPDKSRGKRLMKFLDKYDFKEVWKVCVVCEPGPLQYCMIEVLPAEDIGTDLRILISAR